MALTTSPSASSAPAGRHWASIGESTFVAGIRLLWAVHRVLGRLPFRVCLYPVVFSYWLCSGLARRSSMQYLQRIEAAHGVLGHAPTWRDTLRHFFSFAETLLDKLLAISGRYRFEQVKVEGRELLQAQARSGRGGLIVTAHVGCLELCRALAEHDGDGGVRLNVLVHTLHAQRFNALLQRLDPGSRVRLLQVTETDAATAVLLQECIERGEWVAIVGDRVPVRQSKTVSLPFLGVEAAFPVGAYVLAALLRCPLFFMGCVRQGDGHVVHFDLLAESVTLPRKDREGALRSLAAAYVQRLESLVQRSPFDWFNFFPFWDQVHGQ
jgi:predicted LPLAT superfamily acyltransferase